MKKLLIILARSLVAYSAMAVAVGAFWMGTLALRPTDDERSQSWDSEPPLVVVDAGHGGHDGGAVANQLIEKKTALDIAQRLKTQLEKQGLRVLMTRDNDVFIPLEKRAKVANDTHAAVFVSVHLNTAVEDAANIHGLETYFSDTKGLQTIKLIKDRLQIPTPVKLEDRRGKELAESIQRIACRRTEAENRGTKERSLTVIHGTACPSVLVECGFLTHKKEAGRLSDADYKDRLASGIADGVVAFLRAQSLQPHRGLVLTEPKSVPPMESLTARN